MEKNPTSTDRNILIRVAASLPKGDEKRRILLAELQKSAQDLDNAYFNSVISALPRRVGSWDVSNQYGAALFEGSTGWEFGGMPAFSFLARPEMEFGGGQVIVDLQIGEDSYGGPGNFSVKWTGDAKKDAGILLKTLQKNWGKIQGYWMKQVSSSLSSRLRLAELQKQARGWDGKLEGPKARAKWVRRGQFPYMEIEELPGKPFKRKLRKAEFRWSNHAQQWPLLMENVLDDARLSKNMSYDQMVRAMQNALKKIPGKYDEKAVARFGPLQDYVKKELDRQPYESQVFYLNVEPVNYEPITFSGKGFHGTSQWTKFVFYEDADRDDYMAQMEGMRAKNESKSAGGARKLFKMLKANPDLTRNMSTKDFVQLLAKNKIGYDYWPTVWR